MNNLNNKVALVTGAASKRGMGHAIAIRLAKEGASVAIVDQYLAPQGLFGEDRDQKWGGLNAVAKEIKNIGQEALAIVTDVSKSKEVNEMVKKTLARFGKIDILVNTAGIPALNDVPIVDLPEKDWNWMLAVNLTGPFLVCKAVAKSMIEKEIQGRIINISSIGGKKGVPGHAHYSASKFGLIGLTQCSARELAPYKITVNAVCPGRIVTNIRDKWLKERAQSLGITIDEARVQFYEEKSAIIPLKRPGKAEDIANIVAFLASSEADFITGQSINVDGGELMEH